MSCRINPVLLWRLAVGIAAFAVSSACGSAGCQSCAPEPIPGGFPKEHRFDNLMQVRLSDKGVGFMETNFASLATMLVPGGLSFTIPPTPSDCSDTAGQKMCCSGATCSATMTIDSTDMTPTPQSTLKVHLRATVKTSQIKYEKQVPLLGWFTCDVIYDSAKETPTTLGLNADVDFLVQANSGNRLNILRGTTSSLEDFACGDIDIQGAWYCIVVDWLCPLFKGTIETQLKGTIDSTLDGMLTSLPMGKEGRFEVASFLAKYSPRTTGQMDFLMWAGGYAQAENNGMSLGVMGGFRAVNRATCVPDCEKPGATCLAPALPVISRSTVFRGNVRPNGKTFDVGIGVDAKALDLAAYAMYASGGLCLDISTDAMPQLSSDVFGLLVPSLKGVTGGASLPMMLSVRPRTPPKVALGKGLFHVGPDGKVVVDEPLLKLQAKDFGADVYVQLDERMVRAFTIVGDLEIPLLLYGDAMGRLQPMVGSLDQALTNIRLENADLITEDAATMAKLFPTVLSLAASFLAGGLDPIDLPSIQNLRLLLDGSSITTTDNDQVLAIFANLGLVTSTSYSDEDARVDTQAEEESLRVPPAEAFRLGPTFDPSSGPTVSLRVSARAPRTPVGALVEYAYRVDGGFYHVWQQGDRILVQDPLFWLQGTHAVEVMARLQGQPLTTDLTPARVEVTIDPAPPEVTLRATPGGVRAEVHDAVTPAEDVALSWSIEGSAFSPFGAEREIRVPPGAAVAVRARDRAGNVATASILARRTAGPEEEVRSGGGCGVGRGQGAGRGLLLVLGAGLILYCRRLRSGRKF